MRGEAAGGKDEQDLFPPTWEPSHQIKKKQGRPGGSAVERLPPAQGVTPESWDRVLRQVPCMEPASPSACLFLSVCVSHE